MTPPQFVEILVKEAAKNHSFKNSGAALRLPQWDILLEKIASNNPVLRRAAAGL